ncbi:MAG TPA: RDD family protein [Pyrinomonadaceae bacterium]|nr:RDD family protein [Pyrinomonadaceae bacterium]
MTLCPSCGAENVDGTKFCVKCGAGISAAPSPGAWEQPAPQQPSSGSGNLYDTPSGGVYNNTPSGGLGGGYQPMSQPPTAYGYGGGMTAAATGVGGYPYAVWADRVLAALVDAGIVFAAVIGLYIAVMIIGTILGGIGMAIGGLAGGEEGAGAGSLLGSGFCCIAFVLFPLASLGIGLYNKVFLVAKRGSSIGQGIMKLKVVTEQGTLVPQGTLLLRLLVQIGFGFVPFLPLLSLLWPLWDPQRQTLHDKAVGTFVVKEGV